MSLKQIVITRCEEPVDAPRGIVFKISLFDNKECVDILYRSTVADVYAELSNYIEDLDY